MIERNSHSLSIISIIIALISLSISTIVGIAQIYYYIYNIRTNYSVKVKILKDSLLEINPDYIGRKLKVNSGDDSYDIMIGIPIEIYISNLAKKHIVIWKVEYKIIDKKENSVFVLIPNNLRLLKNLECDKKKMIYINGINDVIKIEQENTIHCYGIIKMPFVKKEAKMLGKIITRLNKNNITLDNIVSYYSQGPLKITAKENDVSKSILNKEIVIDINTIDKVGRTVLIDKIYPVYNNEILMPIGVDKYYTDTGIEDVDPFGKALRKIHKDEINNQEFIQ